MHRPAPEFWATSTGIAPAQKDSGVGKSKVGTTAHHASIGSFFATGNDLLDVHKDKSGQNALVAHESH